MDELTGVGIPIEHCPGIEFVVRLPEAEAAGKPVEHRNDHGEVSPGILLPSKRKARLLQLFKVGRYRLPEMSNQVGIVVPAGDAAEAAEYP